MIGIKKIKAKRIRECKFKNSHCPKILLKLRKENKKMYDRGYGGRRRINILFLYATAMDSLHAVLMMHDVLMNTEK
jgi:hypothetical protein